MANNDVYNTTTVPEPKSNKCFVVPSDVLDSIRCILKVAEVLLSLVAFVLEEVVTSCNSCSALYFFEFVSCTAFLFTLLLLILLATPLHRRVGFLYLQPTDLYYTSGIFLLFLVASIAFAADNGQTSMELSAVAFGFLSSLVFLLDAAWFIKTKGLPWKQAKPQSSPADGPQPEAEALNPAP